MGETETERERERGTIEREEEGGGGRERNERVVKWTYERGGVAGGVAVVHPHCLDRPHRLDRFQRRVWRVVVEHNVSARPGIPQKQQQNTRKMCQKRRKSANKRKRKKSICFKKRDGRREREETERPRPRQRQGHGQREPERGETWREEDEFVGCRGIYERRAWCCVWLCCWCCVAVLLVLCVCVAGGGSHVVMHCRPATVKSFAAFRIVAHSVTLATAGEGGSQHSHSTVTSQS